MLLLLGCQGPTPALRPTPTPFVWQTEQPILTPLLKPAPPKTPCCQVRFHPEERLYRGDHVSLEVIAPSEERFLNQTLTVTLTSPPLLIGSTTFQPFGFDHRTQATLLWAWDTQDLAAGEYTLLFSIPALQEEWTETISLLPRTAMPAAEQTAEWQTLETACCKINFITNTAAHRDLEDIAEIVERQFQAVEQNIPANPDPKVEIVLIPRLIGNGGFANAEINVSYLDRNYTAGDFATIVRHEIVHVLDHRVNTKERPSLFVEGIAVYLSSGHYQPEPLSPRAAMLYRQNQHLPLRDLATDFYTHQHETAYLQAGALVEYLTQRWGWQTVWDTYLAMSLNSDETHLQAIERSLSENLGISLSQLEEDFFAYLASLEADSLALQDVQSLQRYYETLRAYQQLLDPAAYYRTAWMLDARQMREKGIIADYWRHPSQIENLTLELLLNEAGRARRNGEFANVETILEAVECTLDRLRETHPEPFSCNPITEDAWEIVQALLQAGYEPQMWKRQPQRAEVLVTQGTPTLKQVILEHQLDGWQIISGANATANELINGTQ